MRFGYFIFSVIVLSSCNNQEKQVATDIWTFDVTQEYPKKELYIQDIADVEYLPLETNDSMLWLGRDLDYLDEEYIIGCNPLTNNILFHNREGKALHTFNKVGSGPGEYDGARRINYDKANNEVYVLDYIRCRYYIYDDKGNFKRSYHTGHSLKNPVKSFFILGDELIEYSAENTYSRLSKQTGELLGRFSFGSDSKFGLSYYQNNDKIDCATNYFIKDKDGYILTAFASDTTWLLTPDMNMKPIGVRTPPIASMEVPIFLKPIKNTPRYYFMYTIKKATKYPMEIYMLDKKEKQIYWLASELKNKDFIGQKVHLDASGGMSEADIPANISIQSMAPSWLIDAYNEGKLSGRLKEIAANLKEEDNPVFMIIKFRE